MREARLEKLKHIINSVEYLDNYDQDTKQQLSHAEKTLFDQQVDVRLKKRNKPYKEYNLYKVARFHNKVDERMESDAFAYDDSSPVNFRESQLSSPLGIRLSKASRHGQSIREDVSEEEKSLGDYRKYKIKLVTFGHGQNGENEEEDEGPRESQLGEYQ